jgi:hypothetical protein
MGGRVKEVAKKRSLDSARAIGWIEQYCRVADGPSKGMRVYLSPDECSLLRRIYDDGEQVAEPIAGRLGVYLILYHLCGPATAARLAAPATRADLWTVWKVVERNDALVAVLRRDGAKITCPELATVWAA